MGEPVSSSTEAHYRRLKKLHNSTGALTHQNYRLYGHSAVFGAPQTVYSTVFLGAPENGTFLNMYDVCNFCIAEDEAEEFIIQFLRRSTFSGHVNIALRIVKGLSELEDGSVIFDGGRAARGDGDERFEIGMQVDFSWGGVDDEQVPSLRRKKVAKCHGLSFNMPGFQIEIVGDFDASKCLHWDDSSRDYFEQTFNFRIDDSTDECYIKFTRKKDANVNNGDYTILTREFRNHLEVEAETNSIDMNFRVRHHHNLQPRVTARQLQQQQARMAAEQESARRIAQIAVSSARAMSNLVGGPKICYRNCYAGYCTC